MPKVFIHGVPETSAIWGSLVDELKQRGVEDIVLLSPPGFGAATPPNWQPTRENYSKWLINELEKLDGDIDLVAHDWGAGHACSILANKPELLHSWAMDCAGLLHADYIWHDMAQAWQTPKVGEEALKGLLGGSIDDRSAILQSLGLPVDIAEQVAGEQDAEMGRCILGLYRSAAQPVMRELGHIIMATTQAPGLVIIATEDDYAGTPESATQVATAVGANIVTLEGLNHWWMFDGAAKVAEALIKHWKAASQA